jgi:hypothetical protein
MRILGKSTSFISVKEDIVDVERGSNKGLVVSNGSRDRAARSILGARSNRARGGSVAGKSGDSPEALINRTNVEINFYFVILYITILPHLSVYFMFQGSRLYLKPS